MIYQLLHKRATRVVTDRAPRAISTASATLKAWVEIMKEPDGSTRLVSIEPMDRPLHPRFRPGSDRIYQNGSIVTLPGIDEGRPLSSKLSGPSPAVLLSHGAGLPR
jgi:hypothetical protein